MNRAYIDRTFNTELNRAYKPLTKDEELLTIVEAQNGCNSARNVIINSQLKQLVSIARKYVVTNSQNDVSELISVGITGYQGKKNEEYKNGLDNAIADFDITSDNRFIAFALNYMRNAIRDYSVDNRLVPVPRNLSRSCPNDPTLVDTYTYEAECRGMTLEAYMEHKNSIGESISLRRSAIVVSASSFDTPIHDDKNGSTLGDVIADDVIDMDMPIVMTELDKALATLTSNEMGFIREHYWNDMSMEEIGKGRGITRQHVHTKITKILLKTKKRYGKVS